MTRHPTPTLRLRVNDIDSLVSAFDPNPLPQKRLDPDIETFVERWANGTSPRRRIAVVIHLMRPADETHSEQLLAQAFRHHFDHKALLIRGELKMLLREGRISLLIGLGFLTLCLLGAEALAQLPERNSLSIVVREGLSIVGWVAMWRPLQIFLYDWWPLMRRIAVSNNLAHATVRVHSGTLNAPLHTGEPT